MTSTSPFVSRLRLVVACGGAVAATALPLPSVALEVPIAQLTPGAIATDDARVVCAPGYASGQRPPYQAGWWRSIDAAVRTAYGVPVRGPARRGWTLDHDVPLELGGAPHDPRNLWPQPRAEARLKDRVEDALHRAVCAGRTISLRRAQLEIMTDWRRTSVGDPRLLPSAFSEREP